jgi:hypothetical protein
MWGGMEEPSIRTPDQRLRVFVSSTLAELADERGAVHGAIEVRAWRAAAPAPQPLPGLLEQSHIFVGIYWQPYGWVAPGETVSGVEDEYLLSNGMPRLLYVKAPAEEREPRLGQLLRRIQGDDTASYKSFRTSDELARLVAADLAVLLSERFTSRRPPTGVVTFLFVEIRGSGPELAESASGEAAQTLMKQVEALRRVIRSRGGYLFSASDQTVRAAFDHPVEALTAVAELQSVLEDVSPADGGSLMFRAALPDGRALFVELAVGSDKLLLSEEIAELNALPPARWAARRSWCCSSPRMSPARSLTPSRWRPSRDAAGGDVLGRANGIVRDPFWTPLGAVHAQGRACPDEVADRVPAEPNDGKWDLSAETYPTLTARFARSLGVL